MDVGEALLLFVFLRFLSRARANRAAELSTQENEESWLLVVDRSVLHSLLYGRARVANQDPTQENAQSLVLPQNNGSSGPARDHERKTF